MDDSWMTLRQAEVCKVALLGCALACGIGWHVPFCKSPVCFIVDAPLEFSTGVITKWTLLCLESCCHRTSGQFRATSFLGEGQYLVMALSGSGTTCEKPSVVAKSALGQHVAACGSM